MDAFGVRRQSGSGDGALGRTEDPMDAEGLRACQSGVVLRKSGIATAVQDDTRISYFKSVGDDVLVSPKSDEGGRSL
jgi:hypothetical protein